MSKKESDTHEHVNTEQIMKALEKREIEIKKKIITELEPFLEGIRTMGTQTRNFTLFKQAYLYFDSKYRRNKKLFLFLGDVIRKDTLSGSGDKSINNLLIPFLYLGTVESVGNSIVDILAMLLVANGRDFHIDSRYTTPRIKHVTSIKDLEEERVPLGTKLNFLKDNGISELTSLVDNKLRNAIAHMNFIVKKGELYVKGKHAAGIALVSFHNLSVAAETVEILLRHLAEERGLVPKGDKINAQT